MIFFLILAIIAAAVIASIVLGIVWKDGEVAGGGIIMSILIGGAIFGLYCIIVVTATGTPTSMPTKTYSLSQFSGSNGYVSVTYDNPGVFYSTNVTVNLGQKNGVPQTLTADISDVKINTTTGKPHIDVISPISHHPILWPWKSAYEYEGQYNIYVPKGTVVFNGLSTSGK